MPRGARKVLGESMSTQKDHLSRISDQVQRLIDLFEYDEYGSDFFERVKEIELNMIDLMASHKRIEHQMDLIIKLLGSK
jgi:hypothetical protein